MNIRPQHHFFLSDAHLGAFNPTLNREIEQSLLALIDYCEASGSCLHILGDLFDYWMEYPGQFPRYGEKLLERFARYHDSVGPTLYITGNHDNWTNGAFAAAGFQVEPEFVQREFGDCLALLLHGDGLKSIQPELKRPLVNRILRSPGFVRFYQKIFPEPVGLAWMRWFSSVNRRLKVTTAKQRLSQWAERRLAGSPEQVIISGHDHLERVETFRFGTYINLGNFYSKRTLAEYNNGAFRLVIWDMSSKKTIPLQEYSLIDCRQ